MLRRGILLAILLLIFSACVPNNAPLGPEQFDAPAVNLTSRLEVVREGVFVMQGDSRQSLSAAEPAAPLESEQGLAVDDNGRAILRFGDRLSLELLNGAELPQIQQSADDQSETVSVAQNGGTLVADLTLSPETESGLTVQTAFGTVSGTNARFAVVREANSPLEWVLALEVPDNGALTVTTGGETLPVAGGQARWFSSQGGPSQSVVIEQNAQIWLENARNGIEQGEIGAALLPPASLSADAGQFNAAPAPGRTVEFGRDIHGAVQLTTDPVGIFGRPAYTLEDCNSDGRPDLSIREGLVELDFSQLLARVEALHLNLLNRAEPGDGLLQTFDPAGAPAAQQQLTATAGQPETLSLRSDQPILSAKLTLADACLLGLSLTPPGQSPAPAPVVAEAGATTTPQSTDAVVNVLSGSAERLPQNGQFQAAQLGNGNLSIDGVPGDWNTLAAQSSIGWASINNVVHDDACAARFPGSETLTDLTGQVQFAYDDTYFYAAFLVADDGLLPYTGADYRYFLGDSPQLLLDLDLMGDFDDAALSADDVQVDLLPQLDAPQAALWRLSTLTSGPLSGAQVAASATDDGYFVEAALPWAALGATPQPGDRLGVAANISDNDSPDANAQQCIITSAPQRDWRNPTSWGTVLLLPAAAE
jgi:hypothetical protein